jgi:predicted outer membrane repeat protein
MFKFLLLPLLALALVSAKNFDDYLIAADTVFLSDYTKTLGGEIYGGNIEIGADAKVYGNVSVGSKCFLRERASISDTLASSFATPCSKQNNVTVGKEIFGTAEYEQTKIGYFSAGSQNISIAIGADELLFSGTYGNIKIDARSKIRLQSGTYTFSSIHTEPDVKWIFDLSNGPVKIYVLNGIRLADRNVFSITGGNPSEIEWRVAGGTLDLGTDGKFFGRFIAPNSQIRLAPRSHIVGGIEARRFQMEPQSTVSMEPRAEEISHSEYNFGPFWYRNNFRYLSAQSFSINSVEMYVYAGNFDIRVDGKTSRNVNLEKTQQTVSVSISRPFVTDFPSEAFSSTYIFAFNKTAQTRIYWHPSSPCSYGCDGLSEDKAVRLFSQALALAQKDGLEIKMVGGVWEATKEQSVFPVGLELIGNENHFWELSAFSDIPVLNVKNHPIEIAGKSPRSFKGLHITEGINGAFSASVDKLALSSMAFTNNAFSGNGGALNYKGKGMFTGRTLLFENSRGGKGGAAFLGGNADIEDVVCSGNSASGEGGCLFVQDTLRLANAVFHGNKSKKGGGGLYAKRAYVWNVTAVSNESVGGYALDGASGRISNSVFWKNTGGSTPASWPAEHSSFTSARSGIGNIVGDPKFLDERNPAGGTHFFGYDAGLVIADKSPALKGQKVDGVLERDLLGTERGKQVAMGAYGDYSDNGNAFQYGKWSYGEFVPTPVQYLFNSLPYQEAIDHVGYGGYGRIIKRLIRKHDKTKVSNATVRITVLDSNFKAYPDITPVEVVFYRRTSGEEEGKYVFETLSHGPLDPGYDPKKHGRLILFSKTPEDQGIHGNFLVIHAKSSNDKFRYEVVEW